MIVERLCAVVLPLCSGHKVSRELLWGLKVTGQVDRMRPEKASLFSGWQTRLTAACPPAHLLHSGPPTSRRQLTGRPQTWLPPLRVLPSVSSTAVPSPSAIPPRPDIWRQCQHPRRLSTMPVVHGIWARPRSARVARGSLWPAGIWKCLPVPESFPASPKTPLGLPSLFRAPEPCRSPTLARRLCTRSSKRRRRMATASSSISVRSILRLPGRTRTRPAGMGTPGDGVAPSQRPLSGRETMMSFVYAKEIWKWDAIMERTICGAQCRRSRLLAASLTGEQKTGFEMGQSTPKKTPDIEATSEGGSHHAHPQRHDGQRDASGTVAVRDGARETDRRIFGFWKTCFTSNSTEFVHAHGLFGTATTRGGGKEREKNQRASQLGLNLTSRCRALRRRAPMAGSSVAPILARCRTAGEGLRGSLASSRSKKLHAGTSADSGPRAALRRGFRVSTVATGSP